MGLVPVFSDSCHIITVFLFTFNIALGKEYNWDHCHEFYHNPIL